MSPVYITRSLSRDPARADAAATYGPLGSPQRLGSTVSALSEVVLSGGDRTLSGYEIPVVQAEECVVSGTNGENFYDPGTLQRHRSPDAAKESE